MEIKSKKKYLTPHVTKVLAFSNALMEIRASAGDFKPGGPGLGDQSSKEYGDDWDSGSYDVWDDSGESY